MKLVPTHFFRPQDLEPDDKETFEERCILSEESFPKIKSIASRLSQEDYVELSKDDIEENDDLQVYLSLINFLGATESVEKENKVQLSTSGPLAKEVGLAIFAYLKKGFPVFDDWFRRYRTLDDRLCTLEFLHHLELQRIKYAKRSGQKPEVLNEIPVSFAIIKRPSHEHQSDVYLFELNKDWKRYNFIGGKQEPEDKGDYKLTLYREIEEEIGVPREKVALTPLTEEPLEAYSLSGHAGVLTKYPCMLYFASFTEEFEIRPKDKWLTEDEIKQLRDSEDPGLMINPIYLDFLLQDYPKGLKGLGYSVEKPIGKNRFKRTVNWIKDNKGLVAAIILLTASIIGLLEVLL